jgi:hypothetical protein
MLWRASKTVCMQKLAQGLSGFVSLPFILLMLKLRYAAVCTFALISK